VSDRDRDGDRLIGSSDCAVPVTMTTGLVHTIAVAHKSDGEILHDLFVI